MHREKESQKTDDTEREENIEITTGQNRGEYVYAL